MSTLRNAYTRLLCSLMVAGTLGAATPASAEVVADWNALTIQFTAAIEANRPPGPYVAIDLAIVHIAMHDAVQAYQHRFKTYNAPIPGASGSMVAAVAKAAHDVLVSRFQHSGGERRERPLIAQVDTAYANYLINNGLAVNDPGVAVGQQAALNIILNRANDGAFPANPEIFTGSTEPGQWRPTPPAFAPMAGPWIGNVTPFVQKDREGLLHEPGPPSLTSGFYTRDYNEVKAMGRRTGSARTPEQTTMGLFFSGANLTGFVRTVALARLTDSGDLARLFALAYVSAADSMINVWNNKRTYNFWRPSTAILEAANDGNPRTAPDPDWLPLINNPPYPDFVRPRTGSAVSVRWSPRVGVDPFSRGCPRFIDVLGLRSVHPRAPFTERRRIGAGGRCRRAAPARGERRIHGDALGGGGGDRLAGKAAAIDEHRGRPATHARPYLAQHREHTRAIAADIGDGDAHDRAAVDIRRQLDVVRRPIAAVCHLHHPRIRIGRRHARLRHPGALLPLLGRLDRWQLREGFLDPGHPVCSGALLGRLRARVDRRVGLFVDTLDLFTGLARTRLQRLPRGETSRHRHCRGRVCCRARRAPSSRRRGAAAR